MLLSYWWLLLLLPSAGGVVGYVYSINQEQVYEANATLLVQQRSSSVSPGLSDFSVSEQLASTYARLVTASPFLESVKEKNDLTRLGVVSTRASNRPPILDIRVQDNDPVVAAKSADVISRDFIDYTIELRLAEIARLQAAAAAHGILDTQDLDPRYSRVQAPRQRGGVPPDDHGPELDHPELAPTVADATLIVKHRPRRRDLHQQRRHKPERRCQEEHHDGDAEIHGPLCPFHTRLPVAAFVSGHQLL